MTASRWKQKLTIGLVGPSGAGKSSVAQMLVSEYGFIRIHAARPVKAAFCSAFGVDQEWLDRKIDTPAPFLDGVAPREILEIWGHTLNERCPMALPNALRVKLETLRRHKRVLVDGIRRQTEAEVVREWNGKIIRIEPYKGIDPNKPCDQTQRGVVHDFQVGAGGHLGKLLDQARDVVDGIFRSV